MPRIANPTLTQEVADRLARYYADDPITITVRALPRQGLFIVVTRDGDEGGLYFHVDQVRNGASGFRDEALAKINAYRDDVPYEPRPVKPGLRYDDIMTYGSPEALNVD